MVNLTPAIAPEVTTGEFTPKGDRYTPGLAFPDFDVNVILLIVLARLYRQPG